MKLNISKFKKVAENDNGAVLQHPNGHKIVLHKGSLSEDHKKQLSELPMYADGGSVNASPLQDDLSDIIQQGSDQAAPDRAPASDAPTPDVSPADKMALFKQGFGAKGILGGIADWMNPTPTQAQAAPAPQVDTSQVANQQAPSVPAKASKQGGSDLSFMYPPGYKNMPNVADIMELEKQGVLSNAEAQGKIADLSQRALDNQQSALDEVRKGYMSQTANLNDEVQSFLKAAQDKTIDPRRLWAKMDTPNKISTMAGIAFGSIGSAISGQPNEVMGMVQNAIKNDIEAQKLDLGKNENLLSAALRHYGNINDATNMLTNMYTLHANNEIRKAALQYGGQQALSEANLKLADFEKPMVMQMQQWAMQRALAQAAATKDPDRAGAILPYMRSINPEMAKDLEERTVPSVGVASVKVPEAVRSDLVSNQELMQSLSNLESFASTHSGSLDPKIISTGNALMNIAKTKWRLANHEGVPREAEMKFDGALIGNPTQFLNTMRSMPAYQIVKQAMADKYAKTIRAYGIPQKQIKEMPAR